MSALLLVKAREFALQAHDGQHRRSGEAYINHPRRVAERVKDVLDESRDAYSADEQTTADEIVAAAWLHDVAEDCYATIEQGIYALSMEGFSTDVIRYVKALSHSKEELYADYILRVQDSGYGPTLIKCEDLWDNTRQLRYITKNVQAKYMLAYALLANKRLNVPAKE